MATIVSGRLSELFCVILCTIVVDRYAHIMNSSYLQLSIVLCLLLGFLLFLWSPYVIGQTIYFHPVVCSFFLSFFPRLISAVRDWMSAILPHMMWP